MKSALMTTIEILQEQHRNLHEEIKEVQEQRKELNMREQEIEAFCNNIEIAIEAVQQVSEAGG